MQNFDILEKWSLTGGVTGNVCTERFKCMDIVDKTVR